MAINEQPCPTTLLHGVLDGLNLAAAGGADSAGGGGSDTAAFDATMTMIRAGAAQRPLRLTFRDPTALREAEANRLQVPTLL